MGAVGDGDYVVLVLVARMTAVPNLRPVVLVRRDETMAQGDCGDYGDYGDYYCDRGDGDDWDDREGDPRQLRWSQTAPVDVDVDVDADADDVADVDVDADADAGEVDPVLIRALHSSRPQPPPRHLHHDHSGRIDLQKNVDSRRPETHCRHFFP